MSRLRKVTREVLLDRRTCVNEPSVPLRHTVVNLPVRVVGQRCRRLCEVRHADEVVVPGDADSEREQSVDQAAVLLEVECPPVQEVRECRQVDRVTVDDGGGVIGRDDGIYRREFPPQLLGQDLPSCARLSERLISREPIATERAEQAARESGEDDPRCRCLGLQRGRSLGCVARPARRSLRRDARARQNTLCTRFAGVRNPFADAGLRTRAYPCNRGSPPVRSTGQINGRAALARSRPGTEGVSFHAEGIFPEEAAASRPR